MNARMKKLVALLPLVRLNLFRGRFGVGADSAPPLSIELAFSGKVIEVSDLVDFGAQLQAAAASIEEIQKCIKAIIIANDVTPLEGTLFRAVTTPGSDEGVRLDVKAIRETMGDAWCEQFEVDQSRSASVRYYSRKGVKQGAAAIG